jgi:hypothetical protein
MRKALIALVATFGLTAAMALPAEAATMAPNFGRGGGVHAPAGPDWGSHGRYDRPGRDWGPGRYGHGCYGHGRFDHGRYDRRCERHWR